jgi:acyl carrier protein
MAQDVEKAVKDAVLEVAKRKKPALREVGANQALFGDLGLGSLDLAEVVANLDMDLGVEPFATKSIADIRTVGDLCSAYAPR